MADLKSVDFKTLLRAVPSLKGPFPKTNLDALPDTPQEAFRVWFETCLQIGVLEPHAMTLSTCESGKGGRPDSRVLILKNVDERGFHFAIRRESPKGIHIALNQHVALCFYWPQLGREVRIRGRAKQLPQDECVDDFLERSPEARIAAMASKQSQVLSDPGELESRLREAKHKLERDPGRAEPGWKVYAVLPEVAEFFQASSDRLHKRLRYVLAPEGLVWRREYLWP